MVTVRLSDIQSAIRQLGLTGQVLCLHSSLRSFGQVTGGAPTVVQAFLNGCCTLLVPAHSYDFAIVPPPELQPARNGWDYRYHDRPQAPPGKIYTPAAKEIDREMGAIPAAVLQWPAGVRGDHPL